MPRFAANLSMMFGEVEFLDRFAAAQAAGFDAVEYLFPYDYSPSELSLRLSDLGLAQALFNLPPGDWESGDRGFAALPGSEDAFDRSLDQALVYADVLGCPLLHAMAGIPPADADPAAVHATYVANLANAAERVGACGRTLVIEPINTRTVPGYFLTRQAQAMAVIAEVGSPHLALQFDIFHCQIMDGDAEGHLRRQIAAIRHIQIAGVPDRHEPDTGEVDYRRLFAVMDELGYAGYVGCEYQPAGDTVAGLGWFEAVRG
ncbi:MAG: hydroxypyruvate isomerase family protein [Rhodospirillaceae bacterium]|nr:hydroxypyruvate isomerase family protein [Rhodospirillaceae bacterium]MCA8933317.1 hydroxypyruvate isomerase family protein [Rhodospirillaceae bacterium]